MNNSGYRRKALTGRCFHVCRVPKEPAWGLVQLQVAFFDPAELSFDLTENAGEHSRQYKADQDQAEDIEAGDRGLCSCGNIIDPAGIYADLTPETSGAHSGGHSRAVHLHFENAGRDRSRNG